MFDVTNQYLKLAQLAKTTGLELKKRGFLLATAESCTGGGLSFYCTSVPSSSAWFERGFVTYSNAAKIEMLGVNPATIATFGAVSAETAQEMAIGALQHSHAQVSIAVTGIAGPAGGSEQKPTGTVWIAWARKDMPTQMEVEVFVGEREDIRHQVIEKALNKLKNIL
jgi:nicotinamide-nucleotide amidase